MYIKNIMGIDTYAYIPNTVAFKVRCEIIDKFKYVDLCRGYVYGEIYSYRGGRYNPFLEELKGDKFILSADVSKIEVEDIYQKLCIFVGETLPDYKKFIESKNKIMCNENSGGINKAHLFYKTLPECLCKVRTKASDDIQTMTLMADNLRYLRKEVIKEYNPNIERRIYNSKTDMDRITENLNVVCGGFYEWGKLYTGGISILEIVELMEFYKICVDYHLTLYHTY